MDTLHTLVKPVVTEKATALSKKFTYSFWINRKATKIDVKKAIQEVYDVKVASVRILVLPAKKRAMRRNIIEKRHKMKKALVTLVGRKKLDITKIIKEKKQLRQNNN